MRRHSQFVLAAVVSSTVLLGSGTAVAQTGPARVVKDINTTPTSQSGSSPTGIVNFHGQAFFFAFSLETGTELWKSDGTDSGTVLVKDIRPGPLGSNGRNLTVAGDTVFFLADDGTHGFELWKSDGTESGTMLVKDIYPGPASSLINVAPIAAGGKLFLVAYDGVNGDELWKSDGTEAGTSLVKDIEPGVYGSRITQLTALQGRAVFMAFDDDHGYELWGSDGTEAGTELLADLQPGRFSSIPHVIGRAGSFVYFSADFNPYYGFTALLKTDGTAVGTSLVVNCSRLVSSSGVEFNGVLYFTARSYTSDLELWRSDGTATGTFILTSWPVAPGGDVGGLGEFTEFQGDLYFTLNPGDFEHIELWKTHGGPYETSFVKYLGAGGGGSGFFFFVETKVANGGLVFRSFDDEHGFELWKSDGTEEGTSLIKDIRPGAVHSFPSGLVSVNGVVFFAANDGVHQTELWKSDGTEAGTVLVKDINSLIFTAGSFPGRGVTLGRKTLFVASGDGGPELWSSDGTEAGTYRVKDIRPGPTGSAITMLTAVGATAYFLADDGVHGRELWKSDGTEAGTALVRDVRPGAPPSNAQLINVAYGLVFFDPDDGVHGRELWKSDGTEAGTVLVKDINPGPADSLPLEFPEDYARLFFDADDGIHGFELWTSDGTEAGTVLVKDINPGPESSFTGTVYGVNGTFLFDADDGIHGRELWRTDGSDAGTALVKDINPGDFDSYIRQTVRADGKLFFSAYNDDSGEELWKSDGSEGGTVVVKDLRPGPDSGSPGALTRVGSSLFFTASDEEYFGVDLWKSDGTEDGTVVVKNFSYEQGSPPQNLADIEGTLFFLAGDLPHAQELWRSDGTARGTVLAQDLAPQEFSGAPTGMTLAGSRLYFSANDRLLGRELWAGHAAILADRPDRAIHDLREDVEALNLPRGIEQSLTAHLSAAEASLGQPRGVGPAMKQLEAFRRDVERRTPKPITEEQSAELLGFLDEIEGLLDENVVLPVPVPVQRPLPARPNELNQPRRAPQAMSPG